MTVSNSSPSERQRRGLEKENILYKDERDKEEKKKVLEKATSMNSMLKTRLKEWTFFQIKFQILRLKVSYH